MPQGRDASLQKAPCGGRDTSAEHDDGCPLFVGAVKPTPPHHLLFHELASRPAVLLPLPLQLTRTLSLSH